MYTINNIPIKEDEIYHYGIRGMRWGRRKARTPGIDQTGSNVGLGGANQDTASTGHNSGVRQADSGSKPPQEVTTHRPNSNKKRNPGKPASTTRAARNTEKLGGDTSNGKPMTVKGTNPGKPENGTTRAVRTFVKTGGSSAAKKRTIATGHSIVHTILSRRVGTGIGR